MIRTLVVVGLSVLCIGLTLPNIWLPFGSNVDANVDSTFTVTSVDPGSTAELAGLRPGDRIEPWTTDLTARAFLRDSSLLGQGQSVRFIVDRNGDRREIVVMQPTIKTGDYLLGLIKRTSVTLFVLTAAVLLLLRPSSMLWGFFLFAIGSIHGSPLIIDSINPAVGAVGGFVANSTWDILGTLGLLLFGTRFPSPSSQGIRLIIARWTPAIVALVILAQIPSFRFMVGIPTPPWVSVLAAYVPAIAYTLGITALLAGYFEAEGAARQRLRWVIAGFGIYWVAELYLKLAPLFPHQLWPLAWSNFGLDHSVLNGLVIFIPITVAYAVLKHHVLDINFVIGRGLVYAILTSFAVATFAVIEWLLGGVLAQTKLATAGEVLAAIAMGFGLNGMHARVDRFVDAVIFRRKHLAEQRLARVAAGLPHLESYSSIAEIAVREPLEALGLRSGFFFRRFDDGVFRCEAALGAAVGDAVIRADQAIIAHLHGERGPVALGQVGWQFPATVEPASMPVVAFPMFVRHELRAIAFYGGHDTGEAIDPDEIQALSGVCAGAASAIDHCAAAEIARRLDDLRKANEALKADVQLLRRSAQAASA